MKMEYYEVVMIVQIAVIEDIQADQEHLVSLVERYCASRNVTAGITCFSSGDAFLKAFRPGRFQCVFVDIYMEGTDGMETARIICREDPACRIIFSTVSISHAVASYEVRAAWYLTKPIGARRLADAMDTVCLDLLHRSRALKIHVHGTPLRLPLGDIFYLDSLDRQARIHLQDRTLEADEPVGALMDTLLQDERFLSCNRNTVVNLDHVTQAKDHDFLLENGVAVPLRQRGRAALRKAYLAWSLRELRREEPV